MFLQYFLKKLMETSCVFELYLQQMTVSVFFFLEDFNFLLH